MTDVDEWGEPRRPATRTEAAQIRDEASDPDASVAGAENAPESKCCDSSPVSSRTHPAVCRVAGCKRRRDQGQWPEPYPGLCDAHSLAFAASTLAAREENGPAALRTALGYWVRERQA